MTELLHTVGVSLCEGSFRHSTNDEMIQSEGGKSGTKSDNYDTFMLFQNPYSLRMCHEILWYIPNGKENNWWKGLSFHLSD